MRELALRVPAAAAEDVLDGLLPIAPHGVLEIARGDEIELRLRGSDDELPAREAVIAAGLRWGASLREREVPDEWPARRLADYEPLVVADRLLVRPAWAPPAAGGLLDVVLADEHAFGVGTHPTTRACLEALCALEPAGAAVDLGCGSGVLAIAAARLGWRPVLAVDRQASAVAAARANAEHSGVGIDVREGDAADAARTPAAVVLANVPLAAHRAIAAALDAPPPVLIASGVQAADADALAEIYAAATETGRVVDGGWATLTFERRG